MPPEPGLLPIVAAVAVHDALCELTGLRQLFAIKWPNDILAESRKLAGILTEQHDTPSGPVVVVGIGVNIRSNPAVDAYPTARLQDYAGKVTPDALWEAIDRSVRDWLTSWCRSGFDPVRQAWLESATGIGQTVRVRSGNDVINGRCITLDDHGHLILEVEGGHHRSIYSGEVILRESDN